MIYSAAVEDKTDSSEDCLMFVKRRDRKTAFAVFVKALILSHCVKFVFFQMPVEFNVFYVLCVWIGRVLSLQLQLEGGRGLR